MTINAGAPTPTDVRDWTGVGASAFPDATLQRIIDTEAELQDRYCVFPEAGYVPPLFQACLRRCAREIAARGAPLGLTSADIEYGPVRLPNRDPEIDRLEAPYAVIPVA